MKNYRKVWYELKNDVHDVKASTPQLSWCSFCTARMKRVLFRRHCQYPHRTGYQSEWQQCAEGRYNSLLSAQHRELAAKLYQMSQLIREWDVLGNVMFFPGLCLVREPFNSVSLQVVPAYIHLWMHLISLFCCIN